MDQGVGAARATSSSRSVSHRASVATTSNTTFDQAHSRAQSLAQAQVQPRFRPPRSLPPWIDSYESDTTPLTDEQIQLLRPPQRSVLPQHNYDPSELERRVSKDGFVDWARDPLHDQYTVRQKRLSLQQLLRGSRGQQGRKWDHLRTAEPVIVAATIPQAQDPATAWRNYLQSSIYGRMQGEESEVVDPEVLDKLQPQFNLPFEKPISQDDRASGRRRRRTLWERIWRVILRHPLVPLAFRIIVLLTSIASLAVAARIFRHEDRQDKSSAERTQSIVAIVVDTVAVPYIGYMLWDEYTGKPLGLRRATQKISLILLDLFFIIFKSASTSLAFESLVYHTDGRDEVVTTLSRALASMMFVGLLAWTMNFMVNIFRTVARLGPGDG